MSAIPASWNAEVHQLWASGERNEAIQQLLGLINQAGPRPAKADLAQFAYYLFLLADFPAAANILEQALALYPDDLQLLLNLAVARSRMEDHNAAIAAAQKYAALGGSDPMLFDTLANVFATVGRYGEAKAAGERALALKDQLAPIPEDTALAKVPADADSRSRIIAFSLWGSNPRYLRGALHNALLASSLFPDWTCRFYVDSSVDKALVAALRSLGSEIAMVVGGKSDRQRLCRRFLVADDPGVGRYLVRDCDSVLSEREARAVDHWLHSNKGFHVMRDWWTHTDPMLAGMWGGTAGVLPKLGPLIAAYRPNRVETANWDQWFLRDRIWPLIRDRTLVHDRWFNSRGAVPFPTAPTADDRHIGQDEFTAHRAEQEAFLGYWIGRLPCLRVPP